VTSVDGKNFRHSFDGERHSGLHSIAAWSKSNALVLAQARNEGKKNGNTSVLEM